MNKKEWRATILHKRESLTDQEWIKLSKAIKEKLISTGQWRNAKHIAIYHSTKKEVDTLRIIRQAWAEGKKTYLPKSYPQRKEIHFFEVTSFEQLEIVYYGIPEPKTNLCPEVHIDLLDLVIVPGLVFDLWGYRIGYGGGYYDRFLSKVPEVTTISLAFDFQITQSSLPKECFDIPVQHIITNQAILSCITDHQR